MWACRSIVAAGASIEVWAFGRVPLAISACCHARIQGLTKDWLTKDSYQFVCGENPDAVEALDDEPFLAIKGVQTLSYSYCNLLDDVDALADADVKSLRLSSHSVETVAQVSRARRDGQCTARETTDRIADVAPSARFPNGFRRPGCMWSGADRTETRPEAACEHAP